MRLRRVAAALCVVPVVVAGACGGDSDDDGPEAAEEGTETTTSESPEPVQSRLSIRPVLNQQPGPCDDPLFPGPEGAEPLCYELGPPVLERPVLELSEAQLDSGNWQVGIQLAPDDATKFEQITADSLGRQLAMVLDGKVLSAPTVNSVIEGGGIVIQGGFTRAEAEQLAEQILS